jgi:hypothetical protein
MSIEISPGSSVLLYLCTMFLYPATENDVHECLTDGKEIIKTVQQVEDYVEDDEELDPLSPYVNLSNSDTTVRPTSTQIITFIENTSDGWKRNNRDEADRKRKWMRLSPGTWNDFQNQRQFSIVDETPAVIYVASATKY